MRVSIRLLFTDTDSLCVSIEGCDNIYHQIRDGTIHHSAESSISSGDGGGGQSESSINYFDVSGYPSEHSIFSGMDEVTINRLKQMNKKIPGKMKDEVDGNILLEFVGLRANAYAFQNLILHTNAENKEEEETTVGEIIDEKKLKGIQKCVVKRNLNFDHYKTALFEQKTHVASTVSLRSDHHEIHTLAIRKVAMGPYDDKRYLLEDGISSVPFGHHTIQS